MNPLLKRITVNPDVCGGKPSIRDLRYSVSSILELKARGVSDEEILAQKPSLEPDDLLACQMYADSITGWSRRLLGFRQALRAAPEPLRDVLVLARYLAGLRSLALGSERSRVLEKERLQRVFARRRDPWDYDANPGEGIRHQIVLSEALRRGAATAGRILELGCAEGSFSEKLGSQTPAELICADLTPIALERARQRCRTLPHLRFVSLDITESPPAGRYDLIIAMDVLYHIRGRRRLGNAQRHLVEALNPDGHLILEHGLLHTAVEDRFQWVSRKLGFGSRRIHHLFEEDPRLQRIHQSEHLLNPEDGWKILVTVLRRSLN